MMHFYVNKKAKATPDVNVLRVLDQLEAEEKPDIGMQAITSGPGS